MNVLILSSASEKIDNYYLSIAESVSKYLTDNECNLIFGGCSTSMMGACYQEFRKKERDIQAYTVEKYKDDLEILDKAKKYIRGNTFRMKESMYDNCDLIVALPGGLGTISELTSYIEENRSNDKNIPVIIYNEGGFYNNFFNWLVQLSIEGFIESKILDSYMVANNKDEFQEAFQHVLINKERGKSYGK